VGAVVAIFGGRCVARSGKLCEVTRVWGMFFGWPGSAGWAQGLGTYKKQVIRVASDNQLDANNPQTFDASANM
jgi:hypothetical protein